MHVLPLPIRSQLKYTTLVGVVATLIALIGARPYAGSWNDGSRLATVESLVDRHTLSIDKSIFVDVPKPNKTGRRSPYPPDDEILKRGTQDKLFVDGSYYSDKPPVAALFMAALYQLLQWIMGLRAAQQPSLFVYLMTVFSSGLAYVVAVVCVHRLTRQWSWTDRQRLLFTASFALATMALVYSRQVNSHILLMGVVAALTLSVALWHSSTKPLAGLAFIGALAGLGYTLDLGVGPLLWGCTGLWVAWRSRSFRGVGVFVLGSLPFLLTHHAVNYWLCGSWKPANSIPALLAWPGSPFGVHNMTGLFSHENIGAFLIYAAKLLIGSKGFLVHNLPALLLMVAVVVLPRRKLTEWPELLWACSWTACAWLLYAVASNNSSGGCCSVRWFVPFLPAWFFVIGTLLERCPKWRPDFYILSCGSFVIAAIGWQLGPWMLHNVPAYWLWSGLTGITWATFRFWRNRFERRCVERSAPALMKVG